MQAANVIRLGNSGESMSFNMTPVIDIVFQLIIFFSLVCQFAGAENFPVNVPAGCDFAQNEVESAGQLITVTVIKNEQGKSDFAVGSEKVSASDYEKIADRIAILLDVRLKELPVEGRVVTLRIDKDISYAEAQYALAALAQSTATDIRLAVMKTEDDSK
jgi:biopolymer transport protein ExbD